MSSTFHKRLAAKLSSLSLFRGILSDECINALLLFLEEEDQYKKVKLYGEFASLLWLRGGSLSELLRALCFEDENVYVKSKAQRKCIPVALEENMAAELEMLSSLTDITYKDLISGVQYSGYLAAFECERIDLLSEYRQRTENVSKYGYGIFARHTMFRVDGNEIKPIEAADPISLTSFIGYEDERRKIYENTLALVEGRPAANALLCGDAGTGKSSTVKAVANALSDMGVRLIEIRKDQLTMLPYIMGRIAHNPLKFIIFVDDLSFNKNDDCFSMLKAALEGSASAKADNAVIYATNNRRHIVKETFADRGDDDVHRLDTMQELMSLSERFGLVVYFSKPAKALYLEIVHALAKRAEIKADPKELEIKAEAFALAKGNRSPRAAEQFIKSLI